MIPTEYYPCETEGCEDIASIEFVWTETDGITRKCLEHYMFWVGIADVLGSPLPKDTMRVISPIHLAAQRMAIEDKLNEDGD
jgi:hypothetical protein